MEINIRELDKIKELVEEYKSTEKYKSSKSPIKSIDHYKEIWHKGYVFFIALDRKRNINLYVKFLEKTRQVKEPIRRGNDNYIYIEDYISVEAGFNKIGVEGENPANIVRLVENALTKGIKLNTKFKNKTVKRERKTFRKLSRKLLQKSLK